MYKFHFFIFILSKRPGNVGPWTNLFSGVYPFPFLSHHGMMCGAGNGQTCPTDTSHPSHSTWAVGTAGNRKEMQRWSVLVMLQPMVRQFDRWSHLTSITYLPGLLWWPRAITEREFLANCKALHNFSYYYWERTSFLTWKSRQKKEKKQ